MSSDAPAELSAASPEDEVGNFFVHEHDEDGVGACEDLIN